MLASLRELCEQQGLDKTYWIAYSGGLDSHVLLSLCADLRSTIPIKLRAIHINHCLSPNAHAWSNHCKKICADYAIDFIEHAINIDLCAGDSLEEKARSLRYAVFADYLAQGDVLLTAHQQDDQAETFLLQLLRGSGLKGLAAMPVIKSFAHGLHARPLLSYSRAELHAYALQQQLNWINDESNDNAKFTRNFIRHEVLSLLKTRWPTVTNTIARSALHCAEAQSLLEEVMSDVDVCGVNANTLSVRKLLQLPPAQQKMQLRSWIEKLGFRIPNAKKMAAILNEVMFANHDRTPCVVWDGAELRRYRDELYLMQPLMAHDVLSEVTWNLAQVVDIGGIGKLSASKVNGKGIRIDIESVVVRFRQGGEVVNIAKRGRHTLKNLMQEWGVAPWLRERIPLLFVDDKCIAALGYFIDPDYGVNGDNLGWDIEILTQGCPCAP